MSSISFLKYWFSHSRDYSNIMNRENMKNAMSLYQDDWYNSFAYRFNQLVAMKESQRSNAEETISKKHSKDSQRVYIKTIQIDNSKDMKHEYTDFISNHEECKKTIVMDHPLYSLIENGKGITSLPSCDKNDREYHTFEYETSRFERSSSGNRSNTWSR